MPRTPLFMIIIFFAISSGIFAADKTPAPKKAASKPLPQKVTPKKSEAKKPEAKKPVTPKKETPKKLTGHELFEQKIKPLLVKHCYECHSQNGKEIEGGLELDSPSGMLKGGDSGPMLQAHHVDKSMIIQMLQHNDDVSGMPPENKLSDENIAFFKEWIRLGAPDTRKEIGPTAKEKHFQEGKKHWSFQPLNSGKTPVVKQTTWPINKLIDSHVLAQMEAKGLKPVQDANKRTLIRRVYFDLIGLPPSPKQVNAFLLDQSPDALSKTIDQLLASPQFGQRWGRHWLDVVRFAESSGMEFNFTYPHAWPYRNYVIDSLNQDKPYNQFLQEQISGDLIPTKKGDPHKVVEARKIATSILSFGSKRHNSGGMAFRMDIVDDQINVVTRSMLGLTVSCARCHDHKFDPVPTKDYYSLAGIFLSTQPLYGTIRQKYSNNPTDLLPMGPDGEKMHAAANTFDKIIKDEENILAAKKAELTKVNALVKQANKEKVEAEKQLMALAPKPKSKPQTKTKEPAPKKVVANKVVIKKVAKKEALAEKQLEPNKKKVESKKVAVTKKAESKKATPPKKAVPKKAAPKKAAPKKAAPKKVAPKKVAPKKAVVKKVDPPAVVAKRKLDKAVKQLADSNPKIAKLKAEITPLEAKVALLKKQKPARPQYAMMVRERPKPADTKVAIRGNIGQPGELAPRGFLTAVNVPDSPKVNPKQSGRSELSQWITNPKNPLTARVMVNRIWHHLFGRGIVTTTDNFGLIGKKPTHPELLDSLASQFMKEGWSVKKMIKSIMLTRAYQLSCDPAEANMKIDPNNQLFWRATPRRIEAEAIRDSILTVSGQINLAQLESSTVTPIGDILSRAVSLDKFHPPSNYRSVYLPVVRDYIPEVFDLFDFPSPSLVTGRRSVTNVPSQALYLRNSKFIAEQATHSAKRLLASKEATDDIQRVHLATQWCFGRNATSAEEGGILALIHQVRKAKPNDTAQNEKAWASLFHTLFTTAEFRYLVDIK